MRRFILIYLLAIVSAAHGGGPSVEVTGSVNTVEAGKDYITFVIFGEARLFVRKVESEELKNGNAKWVSLRFENAFLVVHRDKNPVPGFTPNWDEMVDKAISLKEKTIFVQCWGTETLVKGNGISRIDASSAYFREK
jgi:hypothetical protein